MSWACQSVGIRVRAKVVTVLATPGAPPAIRARHGEGVPRLSALNSFTGRSQCANCHTGSSRSQPKRCDVRGLRRNDFWHTQPIAIVRNHRFWKTFPALLLPKIREVFRPAEFFELGSPDLTKNFLRPLWQEERGLFRESQDEIAQTSRCQHRHRVRHDS